MAALPAKAGWGAEVGRMVINSLVRQAVNRVMYQQRGYAAPSYQQPYQDSSNYSYNAPAATATGGRARAHHAGSTQRHQTATVLGTLHYPADQKFVPPPPPYPEVYPGGPDTSISSASGRKHSSAMDLVPPPPPAPSVWDDLTPASSVSAKPPASPGKPTGSDGVKQAMVPKRQNVGGYTRHPNDGGIIGKNSPTDSKDPGAEQVSDSEETTDTVPKPAPDFHRRKVAVHKATGRAGT
ncbi:MAG: hypothetical protein ACREJM_06860 [Candidatus Saccharimonadales bacterium]